MWISAGSLFAVAKEAYRRALTASDDPRQHASHDPLVAVVFAAIAGEAFINELADIAAHDSVVRLDLGPEPPEVDDLISLLSEAEANRAPTGFKFLVGKLALARRTYDKGANPYQDFATLIDLRNALVHLKTERFEGVLTKGGVIESRHPPVIDRLRAKNVLVELDNNGHASWTYLVSTAATAKWACNATAAIVRDLYSSMPASQFKEKVELFYYQHGGFDAID